MKKFFARVTCTKLLLVEHPHIGLLMNIYSVVVRVFNRVYSSLNTKVANVKKRYEDKYIERGIFSLQI